MATRTLNSDGSNGRGSRHRRGGVRAPRARERLVFARSSPATGSIRPNWRMGRAGKAASLVNSAGAVAREVRAAGPRTEHPPVSVTLSRGRLRIAALCVLLLASAAPPSPETVSPPRTCCPDLSGEWDAGSWKSGTNGHKGRLCATLTRVGPNRYRCVFRGTFLAVVPFRYPVTLHVTGCDGSRAHFKASRNMPLFGGTFTCRGSATRRSFAARYTSPQDSGVFTLSR